MALTQDQKLILSAFKVAIVNDLIADIANTRNQFYVFTATSLPWHNGLYPFSSNPAPWPPVGDNTTHVPNDSIEQVTSTYQNMVFGKQVANTNAHPMINRYDWASGTVYTQYDSEVQIANTNFYTGVNELAYYHVYKCLSNNLGAPSLYPPTFSDTSPADIFYQTADGYQWKYMYSIDSTTFSNFATPDFIPVISNANVTGNAVGGTIDVIAVQNTGAFYNTYLSGQFNGGDIQIGGNPLVYGIGTSANSTNNYYVGATFVITEGTGKGQYSPIVGYNTSGIAKQIILNQALTTVPDVTSQWEISPTVLVAGDGQQTTNCIARALINAFSSNSVYAVQILQRGAGYSFGQANVIGNSLAPTSNLAAVELILPPPGGHGANAQNELFATSVGVSVTFSNSESNTISTVNDYRTIGILKNPLFANVTFDIVSSSGGSGSNGTFIPSETIYVVQPVTLTGTIGINTTSNVITGSSTLLVNGITVNDYIFVQSTTTSSQQLAQVVAVANNISLTLDRTGQFTDGTCTISKAKLLGSAIVQSISAGEIIATNVSSNFTTGCFIVGNTSSASANVSSYVINGITKTFSTFNQLIPYIGSVISGSFEQDELVTQNSTQANGYLHSIETISGQTVAFLTNQVGTFNINDTFVGQTSGAIFSITNKYIGDLVRNSGNMLYVENFQPISRANNESETMKVVIQF